MTKEEAIKILLRYDVNFEPYSAEAVIEAIYMAVEAMQKQIDHIADSDKKVEQTAEIAQNVQEEDLISRKTAIDARYDK